MRFNRRLICAALAGAALALAGCSSGAPTSHLGRPRSAGVFSTPQYFPGIWADSFFNTVGPDGDALIAGDDSRGVDQSCTKRGSDIAIYDASGADPADLRFSTVNCMTSYGPRGGGNNDPDGCSWKNGGITRIGRVVYLAVARQLHWCSIGKETNGLQPSFDASIVKSTDGGRTWTNAWGTTSSDGAAPPWDSRLHRYKAMFPQRFTVPFFIQYGPGNTHTVDGANKYLYAVSTDGYAYNGNFLQLARVPLTEIQQGSAWQFYHGSVGGAGRHWTSSLVGATRILQAKNRLSQPAIQYVPALRRYVLLTFYWTRAGSDFPRRTETPYSRFEFYTAPKPWGPWTKVFNHATQRNLWCAASPCQLIQQPGSKTLNVGTPDDWLGLFDPALVQKFVFTRPLDQQALLTDGDWKNRYRYPGENLHMLHVIPFNLTSVLRERSSSPR